MFGELSNGNLNGRRSARLGMLPDYAGTKVESVVDLTIRHLGAGVVAFGGMGDDYQR